MNPELWRQVESLFERALELPEEQRDTWIDQQCGGDQTLISQVKRMLDSDSGARGFVEDQVAQSVVEFHTSVDIQRTRQAGPYRLTEELGRGGMGTVYLGERSDGEYKGEVAVKLIRPGMDTDFFLDRFKRERQAMASLQHPNIARLLDSGTTAEGIPYIVMERVTGRPVNVYCREEKLTVPQIIALYSHVCRAVAHAHHHFIVHRDLKPGNILVEADGTPKLLDFGICKLLPGSGIAGETVDGSQMMTPDYASPEQVRGEPVGVASDVYSLGAVLYELLTEARPHVLSKYTAPEILKAVCDDDVLRPSLVAKSKALARQLEGDIDTILLKALQKSPSRRYSSAEQFAEDLHHVLNHEPVIAHPDTTFYRAGKFVRRHRFPVIAVAAVMVALTVGLIAYAKQAAIAQRQTTEARFLANAMIFDHDRIKDMPGSLATRQMMVTRSLQYLDTLASESNRDENLSKNLADAYLRMGQIQGNVQGSYTGDTAAARVSFQKGLAALANAGDSLEVNLLRLDLHLEQGRLTESRKPLEAKPLYENALKMAETLQSRFPADTSIGIRSASLQESIGSVLRKTGDFDQALIVMSRAQTMFTQLLAKIPDNQEVRKGLASTTAAVGSIQFRLDKPEQARKSMEQAIVLSEELCRQDPSNIRYQRDLMLAYSHLGDMLGNPNYDENLGDSAGARAAFDSMLAVAEKMYKSNPGDQGALFNYGMALGRVASIPLRSIPERIEMFGKSNGMLTAALTKDPNDNFVRINLANHYEIMGDLLFSSGQQDGAMEQFRRAVLVFESHRPTSTGGERILVTSSQKLAECLARKGKASEALALVDKAQAFAQSVAASPNAVLAQRLLVAKSLLAAASVHAIQGNKDEAIRLRQQALKQYQSYEADPGFTNTNRLDMSNIATLLKGK